MLKARLLGCLVITLIAWPFAHRVLTWKADVDPWKLGGFAMYCTPHVVDLGVAAKRDGQTIRLDPQSWNTSVQHSFKAYKEDRRTLGRLASPAELASEIFASDPSLTHLLILVDVTRLDPWTGLLDTRRRPYTYERPAP